MKTYGEVPTHSPFPVKTNPTPTQPTAPALAHTPGPWKWGKSRKKKAYHLAPLIGGDASPVLVCIDSMWINRADVALIASAPTLSTTNARLTAQNAALVKALENVRAFMSSGTPSSDESELLDEIEAALAQAKGQPQT